ncbi:MAG: uracil-DNA glycosylase [Bacteroidales bacterium]|nr:uracil-DNA glycosylase [Bacteroidales bacterium]
MNPVIEESWGRVLADTFQQPFFAQLKQFLLEEKSKYQIFPPGSLIFNAFNLTPFDRVKVVLLGQDPYHDVGQAHGLCFSVLDGVPMPKSLINICKELKSDLGMPLPRSGNLTSWAKQGVLLLNATLTVRAHQAGSHQHHGWEEFTDTVIRKISENREHVVFLLWGNYAQAKTPLIDESRHLVLKAAHPSPLSASRGFFGCRHFSKANEWLQQHGEAPIDWRL